MRGWLTLITLLSVASVGALPAQAQMQSREAIALQNQILELRHDLQTLGDQMASGGGAPAPRLRDRPQGNSAPNDMVAGLLDRVSQLEDQVRQLRGRVDEIGNQVQRQGEDFNKQLGDLSFRLQGAGGGGAAPPRGDGGPPPTLLNPQGSLGNVPEGAITPTPGAQPPRAPEVAMQQGNAALARRDYAAAEATAREVLTSRGPRAYDAQFLLAQALTGKRDYQQAALAYDDTYNRARTGAHAQDALLGLANSLIAINEKRAACDTLNKLRAEFPQPRGDIRESAGAMRQRGGCG